MVEQLDVFLQQGTFFFLSTNNIKKLTIFHDIVFFLQKQKILWNYYLKH